MRILFFTLIPIKNLNEKGIYADMISEFNDQGDVLDYYFPSKKSYFSLEKNVTFNSIVTRDNPQKQSNFIKKFFLYLEIERNFSRLIQRSKKKYDLLIIVTPSIFQLKIINSFKMKNPKAKVLLLLKDIFPDNAIDLGILKNSFPINFLISFFKSIERKLYIKVDHIGCMTPLNIEYISSRHTKIKEKLFLSPNSIKPYEIPKIETRKSLGLPEDKIILIYIGNVGLPQDPDFIQNFINKLPFNYFVVLIGTGSRFSFKSNTNLMVINNNLNQEKVDQFLINADFGLVFLSNKFKVPNFPSKILSYLNAKLPFFSFTNDYFDFKYGYQISPTIDKLISKIEQIDFFLNNYTKFNNQIFKIINLNFFLVSNQIEVIKKIINFNSSGSRL